MLTDGRAKVGSRLRPRLAVAALLAGAVGIAFAPIFVKLVRGASDLGPISIAFWRILLAAPLLGGWLAIDRAKGPARPIDPAIGGPAPRRWQLLLPGLFFAGDLSMWHWSLHYTSAANATLFVNCAPIPVAIFGWLWLKERFGVTFIVGFVLALTGAVVVMRSSSQNNEATSLHGDALGLATALFYGGYQLSVKRLRGHYPVAVIMVCAAGVSLPVLLVNSLIGGETIWTVSLPAWGALVAMAVISHVCGQGLITWSLRHLPVSFSSVSLLVQPVATALLAWPILRETVSALQACGGAVVLAGVFLARRGSAIARPKNHKISQNNHFA